MKKFWIQFPKLIMTKKQSLTYFFFSIFYLAYEFDYNSDSGLNLSFWNFQEPSVNLTKNVVSKDL